MPSDTTSPEPQPTTGPHAATGPTPGPHARRLVDAHVRSLYRVAGDGGLVETNEGRPRPAPRVFVGRSADGAVCHTRRGLAPALAAELRRLADRLPPLPDPIEDPAVYAALEAALEADAPVTGRWLGPAFHFVEPPLPVPADVVEIDSGDHPGFVGPFTDFVADLDQHRPFFGIVRAGAVVAGGFSARTTDDAAEAGVNTNVEHRGQGFAATVVNAWRTAVEHAGRTPLYSTSYDNASSRAVARRLGLRQYAETCWLT